MFDVKFNDRHVLSHLLSIGCKAVPGNKIYNSDGKSFYTDFIGLYDVKSDYLKLDVRSNRPLSLAVFIVGSEEEFDARVRWLINPDLRWPTELILIFDFYGSYELKGSDLFHFSEHSQRGYDFKLANKGDYRCHDQVGYFEIIDQFLSHLMPHYFFANSKQRENELKNDWMRNTLNSMVRFIESDKKMSQDKLLNELDLDSIRGEIFEALRRLRKEYKRWKIKN